jgi:hypothetical protein
MEVRCCCNAGRLVGYLDDFKWKGEKYAIFLLNGGGIVELEVGMVGMGVLEGVKSYRALKSMDIPIEQLRRIFGWRDA